MSDCLSVSVPSMIGTKEPMFRILIFVLWLRQKKPYQDIFFLIPDRKQLKFWISSISFQYLYNLSASVKCLDDLINFKLLKMKINRSDIYIRFIVTVFRES